MQRKWLILYGGIMIFFSIALSFLVSFYLAMQGVHLPWVSAVERGYAISTVWGIAPGLLLGLGVTYGLHRLAMKSKKPMYYYAAGVIVIIIVIAVVVLLAYGGACAYCKEYVCKPNPVSSCGIKSKLSVTLLEIVCACMKP